MDSPDAYLEFQRTQASLLVDHLTRIGIDLRSKQVLDAGCSWGGYALAFHEAGAKVLALEIDMSHVHPDLTRKVEVVLADALELPFRDRTFDFIFCASLIEHTPRPRALLDELKRALAYTGVCYLSFPPFYTPLGGHQFKPFHLFGERVALWVYRHRRRNEREAQPSSYRDAGLYPRTVRSVRKLTVEAGFEIQDESTRFLPVTLSRIPLLSEFLTWHVQFLLRHRRQKSDGCLSTPNAQSSSYSERSSEEPG